MSPKSILLLSEEILGSIYCLFSSNGWKTIVLYIRIFLFAMTCQKHISKSVKFQSKLAEWKEWCTRTLTDWSYKNSRQFVNSVCFNLSIYFMYGVHFGFYSLYFHPLAKYETIILASKGNNSVHSRHILQGQTRVGLMIISDRYHY